MLGTKYELTLKDMKVFFGFPTSGVKERPSSFNAAQAWYELIGFHNWNPKGTSSKFLRDHALYILHKYLAYTLSGKEQANKVNSTEVYLLWCAKTQTKVCLSTFFWASIQSMVQRAPQHPSFCAFISALAIKLGVIEADGPHPADQTRIPSYRIDRTKLKRAQIINDDLSLFPPAKRSCVEKLRFLQEATMRTTGEGTSRAREEADAERLQRRSRNAKPKVPRRRSPSPNSSILIGIPSVSTTTCPWELSSRISTRRS